MFVTVNGAKLYFDVDGPGLVPDGKTMCERPTLILLHGGPGFDHSGFKPDFSTLTDVAQVVYLDHRGNGRSEQQTHRPGTWPSGATTYGPSATCWASTSPSSTGSRSVASWRSRMPPGIRTTRASWC